MNLAPGQNSVDNDFGLIEPGTNSGWGNTPPPVYNAPEVEPEAEPEPVVFEEIVEFTAWDLSVIEIIEELKIDEENSNQTHNSAGWLDVELPTFLPATGAGL